MTADDPERILRKRSRRKFLGMLLGSIGITSALWYRERGELPAQDTFEGVLPNTGTLLSSHIDDVKIDGNTLFIDLADDTTADACALMHTSREDIGHALTVEEIENPGEQLSIDLIDAIGDQEFPSRDFDIALYHGESGFVFVAEEEIDRITIEIPAEATDRTVLTG